MFQRSLRELGEVNGKHRYKTVGAASRFQLMVFLLTLCVVAGVKIARSGQGSLMTDWVALGIDASDPFWSIFGWIVAIALGVCVEAEKTIHA